MPRSTGGGSHSGGSSSSSHSSGGSHSSGYSSSRSGSSTSRSSYSGSSRSNYGGSSRGSYARPSAHGASPRFAGAQGYSYTNSQSGPREKHNGRLIFYIILVVAMIAAYWDLFTPPAKLEAPLDQKILIEDNCHVIQDSAALARSLRSFLDRTGIVPAVITIQNESWNLYYRNLASKAFDVYVNRFRDEQHWLIVYSEPTVRDPAFNDWYWEGMAGEDTAGILTNDILNYFNARLQRYLTDEQISVDDAISRAFDEIAVLAMETSEYTSNDLPLAVMIVGGFAALGLWRSGYWPERKKRPAGTAKAAAPEAKATAPEAKAAAPKTKAAQAAKECVCQYCGSVFPDGALQCPNCGAARSIRE